jgi:hypothetical protein
MLPVAAHRRRHGLAVIPNAIFFGVSNPYGCPMPLWIAVCLLISAATLIL